MERCISCNELVLLASLDDGLCEKCLEDVCEGTDELAEVGERLTFGFHLLSQAGDRD